MKLTTHARRRMNTDAYLWSVNTPRTTFALRVDHPRQEAEVLRHWEAIGLYRQAAAGDGKPRFLLHDVPLLAHGPLPAHQMLNRLLKDMVLKFRGMQGYAVPFIPAWGLHGLPIEIAVARHDGGKAVAATPQAARRRCAARATAAMAQQRTQLQRLGIRADYDAACLTIQPSFEGAVLRTFGALLAAGAIARDVRPVRWCPACRMALSDAELDGHAWPAPGVHVALPVLHMPRWLFSGEDRGRMSAAAWTTAPWTLPGATGVALHPEVSYALVMDRADTEGFTYLVARDRVRLFSHALEMREPYVLGEALGKELASLVFLHPLSGRELPVVLTTRVETDPGSGVAVVCPGADADDYALAAAHGLPVVPVADGDGRLTAACGPSFHGLALDDAQHAILTRLDHDGVLLSFHVVEQAGEQCWRCRGPVIQRAVAHWVLRVAAPREQALTAVESIHWQPAWGAAQMTALLAARPDWCLSRQRLWGIPIPALVCGGCEEPLLTPALVARIAECLETDGADAWWTRPPRAFLPDGARCPLCGGTAFRKSDEIFEGGFEAACSLVAAQAQRAEAAAPAELVLEGHDQYRGWLQGALLIAAALEQPPPYRAAATHGFVRGGTDLWAVVKTDGAELLRWWAALCDTRADVGCTATDLARVRGVYQRVRGAAHRLLGHLYDFLPGEMTAPDDALAPLDRWLLDELDALTTRVTAALEALEMHHAAHALVDFCGAVTARYLPAARGRLFAAAADDPGRRAAQTACYTVVERLARLLAPLLSFTAEEIWRHLPAAVRPASPQLAAWPVAALARLTATEAERWALAWAARRTAQAAVQVAKAAEWISSPSTAKVTLYLAGKYQRLLELSPDILATVCGVAAITTAPGDDAPGDAIRSRDGNLAAMATPAPGARCPRCRQWRVPGGDIVYPALCAPCAAAA